MGASLRRIYRYARCGKLMPADAANLAYMLVRICEAIDYVIRCESLASPRASGGDLPPHFQ